MLQDFLSGINKNEKSVPLGPGSGSVGNQAAVATRLPLNATGLLSYWVISIQLVPQHKGGKESYIERKIKRAQHAENKMP